MLLVQENTMKLGGVKLPGQVEKISVSETASIEDIQDDKGKTKANQPTGYEAAKVSVKIILEDSEKMTIAQQITTYQRLFKPYGQTKAKLLKLVGEDFSTRGISKVYFKQLTHDNTISQSEDGDEAYGFGFLDFAHGEDDELTRMEIGQRVRDKLAKREYLDQRKTMQNISFENGVFIDQISVAKQDSKEEYNIELSTNEVEVETE